MAGVRSIEPSVSRELDFGEYLTILRRRWQWIPALVVVVATVAGVLNVRRADSYTAQSLVLVANTAAQQAIDPTSQNINYLSRELSNEISLAHSDPVKAEVVSRLGALPSVEISSDESADVLVFESTQLDAEEAALFANTWAEVYVASKQEEASASLSSAVDQFRDRLRVLRDERQDIRQPLDAIQDRIALAATEESADQLERQYLRLSEDLAPELNLVDIEIEAISSSITELQLNGELAAVGTARLIQVAAPPTTSNKAALGRDLILGGFLGLFLGFGIALLRHSLDQSIEQSSDVASTVGVPVLAAIPRPSRRMRTTELGMAVRNHPEGPVADGYQKVRSALQFAGLGQDLQSLMVTSANQAEGKTTSASNLGFALAAIGERVVLADVDLRRPRLHQVFGIDMVPGLSDCVLENAPLHDVAYFIEHSENSENENNMVVLSTGTLPPSPGDFLASTAFVTQIQRLRAESNYLILDAPPVLPVSDALTVARHVDATILTVKAGETTREQLANAVRNLEQAGAAIVGIILIGAKQNDAYGKYGYYGSELEIGRRSTPGNVRKRSKTATRLEASKKRRAKQNSKPEGSLLPPDASPEPQDLTDTAAS